MGYLSWIIALIFLALTNGFNAEGQNIIIANLLQTYSTVNIIFTVLFIILFLLALATDSDEFATYFGIILFFRVSLTIAAIIMAANFTPEGLNNPALFWIGLVFSLVFGGF